MAKALSQLIDDIDLEKIDINIFRGNTVDQSHNSVYGGQVLAQAVNAAGRTVASPLVLHSLHSYFLREGDPDIPIIFEIDRIRDGRTFTTRRVVAIQHGRAIFNASMSYQLPEHGCLEHSSTMPDVIGPDNLISDEVYYREMLGREVRAGWPVEYRQVEPVNPVKAEDKPLNNCVWFKSDGEIAEDRGLHQELLAYATDHLFLNTAARPYSLDCWGEEVMLATLDHALWYHRPFRIDEWLLYEMESTAAFGARAFCRGRVFNSQGELVASTSQEGLIREEIGTP